MYHTIPLNIILYTLVVYLLLDCQRLWSDLLQFVNCMQIVDSNKIYKWITFIDKTNILLTHCSYPLPRPHLTIKMVLKVCCLLTLQGFVSTPEVNVGKDITH
jgi:hypothetical protein